MSRGRYGVHGGQYVPEILMNELICLEESYEHYKNDSEFISELNTHLNEYAGRPSLHSAYARKKNPRQNIPVLPRTRLQFPRGATLFRLKRRSLKILCTSSVPLF